MIRILSLGDVFGRPGRTLVHAHLPRLRAEYSPDCIIANSENLTNGRGPSLDHIRELQALGIDCLTGGNHSFARMAEIAPYMDTPESIQIRPLNYPQSRFYRVPGRGYRIVRKSEKSILVVSLLSSIFTGELVDNPFLAVDTLLTDLDAAGETFDAIVVDFHREATAEMACMGYFLDGRASLVYGTHTHVQTADERILPSGTGYQTDIGMTGTLNSSVGHNFSAHMPHYLSGVRAFCERAEPETGMGVLTALCADIEGGRCVRIERIRLMGS